MSKTYILDTNVFLHDPKALTAFQDNEIVIPLVVLDELDKKKSGPDEVARHARETIRALDEMRARGSIHEGVPTDAGGVIRVELNHKDHTPTDLDPTRADNRIISVALGVMKERGPNHKVIVISKDINLRVKCDALGVYAEDYNTDSVAASPSSIYSGTVELSVDDYIVDELYTQGAIDANFGPMHENQYALLRSNVSPKHSGLARFESGRLVKINAQNNVWGISPRNKEQVCAFDALFDPEIKLVTLIGQAGSGKTLMAAAAGVSQLLDTHTYRRLLLSRPIVPMGRDLGYLPGDLNDKMKPWMAPLQDNLDLLFSDKGGNVLEMYREQGLIEVEALTYIRGRSIPRSFIIVDECQNLTRHEIKTIITRVGEGSKVVLTGDILQIDNPFIDSVDNGLSYVVEKFKHDPIAAHITLTKGERSELATKAAELL